MDLRFPMKFEPLVIFVVASLLVTAKPLVLGGVFSGKMGLCFSAKAEPLSFLGICFFFKTI
jgi:hypothetical protein